MFPVTIPPCVSTCSRHCQCCFSLLSFLLIDAWRGKTMQYITTICNHFFFTFCAEDIWYLCNYLMRSPAASDSAKHLCQLFQSLQRENKGWQLFSFIWWCPQMCCFINNPIILLNQKKKQNPLLWSWNKRSFSITDLKRLTDQKLPLPAEFLSIDRISHSIKLTSWIWTPRPSHLDYFGLTGGSCGCTSEIKIKILRSLWGSHSVEDNNNLQII